MPWYCVWLYTLNLPIKDKNNLRNIAQICFKITGAKQRDCSLWEYKVVREAKDYYY